jgi:hemoglobin
MQAHLKIPELSAVHFARWLELFGHTARETCPPQAASLIIARAEMIAESLQLGLDVSRGVPPQGAAPRP